MAPVSSKRRGASKRAAEGAPRASRSAFDITSTKKDKRFLKHAALLSHLRSNSVGVAKSKRRRRPNNKLATELAEIGDALPDVDLDQDEAEEDDDGWEEIADGLPQPRKRIRSTNSNSKMVMKSVKPRPGAMRRRKIAEGRELERWKKNWAGLMADDTRHSAIIPNEGNTAQSGDSQEHSQAKRWAKLRQFIGGTMQQDKAFT